MQKIVIAKAALVLLAALVIGGLAIDKVQAAKYSFTARGIVTDVEESAKTITVQVAKVDGKGKAAMEGSKIEFIVGKAKVVKVANGKDKRVTYHNFAIGQEVAMKGVANDDDTFTASFARISERKFVVIGLLESFDTAAKTMKILVSSSTYKPNVYKKGTEISMTYNDDTTFMAKVKVAMVASDVNADAQRVKVEGSIDGASNWQVKTLWNNYKAKK